MFEIQAENRDLTDRDIDQPKETHKRGCYLALTFGTLLSSQGADAQQLDPFGFSSLATSHGAPLAGSEHLRGFSAAPEGLGGAPETKIHDREGPLRGGGGRPPVRPPRPAGTGRSPA